ncbi:class I SAM-dependent methyltransferase [Solitalea lacus]|uniref:class I SAM-dependent methyltransferase n=1 Tax=Solitalea lacus TaxID=2911172 RepID=UPI001EDB980D|nr:class I SAM-dependent methyltransferase [Solitalea lacus]UKJ07871.1 class I SAM-dependent methyltransferase [Solitalea lacus]
MNSDSNYIATNRKLWNDKVDYHLKSAFYDVEGFLQGKSSLNTIELELLGDVRGKSMLHLQCHFGQDSLSFARMGASVTGVDLSDKAILAAQSLTNRLDLNSEFICCDVYDLPSHLYKQFDIVFTSYGTIIWLPDLDKWAALISKYLKPGGRFVFVDFHPTLWMFDDNFERINYSYFNADPIIEITQGSYADKEAEITNQSISWNHSLSEIFTALLTHGLQIKTFKEFDYSPYNCFSNMEEFEAGKFRIKSIGNKLPMVYAIEATKTK